MRHICHSQLIAAGPKNLPFTVHILVARDSYIDGEPLEMPVFQA
jgi:hypothetical protein